MQGYGLFTICPRLLLCSYGGHNTDDINHSTTLYEVAQRCVEIPLFKNLVNIPPHNV